MQNSQPKIIKQDFNLLQDLRKAFDLPLLENYPNQTFNQILLPKGSKEYAMIYDKFSATANRYTSSYTISQIRKIDNPFILLHYCIAKRQFLTQNDEFEFEEGFYFHGTGLENLTSICEFNFDRSKIKTHKFGKGISFAKDSSYATHYPQNCKTNNQVMVVAEMFYNNPLEYGHKNTLVPKAAGSYTTKNKAGTVFVKYDDASYYPAYVINYNKKYYEEYYDNLVDYDVEDDSDSDYGNDDYDNEYGDYYLDYLDYYKYDNNEDGEYYEGDYNNDEEYYEGHYNNNNPRPYYYKDEDYYECDYYNEEVHYDNDYEHYYDCDYDNGDNNCYDWVENYHEVCDYDVCNDYYE